MNETELHPDLVWLAENAPRWAKCNNYDFIVRRTDGDSGPHVDFVTSVAVNENRYFRGKWPAFTRNQWQNARLELGLDAAAVETQGDDPVNNPKHYQLLPGVEVIDVRDVLLDKITTTGFMNHRQSDYWSRTWEYITRCMEKGGVEDLKKGRFYLERLIQDMEGSGK